MDLFGTHCCEDAIYVIITFCEGEILLKMERVCSILHTILKKNENRIYYGLRKSTQEPFIYVTDWIAAFYSKDYKKQKWVYWKRNQIQQFILNKMKISRAYNKMYKLCMRTRFSFYYYRTSNIIQKLGQIREPDDLEKKVRLYMCSDKGIKKSIHKYKMKIHNHCKKHKKDKNFFKRRNRHHVQGRRNVRIGKGKK